jgi:hypothetical protein
MDDRNKTGLEILSTGLARRTTIKAMALGSIAMLTGVGLSTPALAETTQAGWRWCSKCQGMFYAMATGNHMGVCPAGGKHIDAGSGHYLEVVGGDAPGKLQGGWSWCSKCMGFFYSRASEGAGGMGHCPAGGTHTKEGSGAYAAVIGEDGRRQQGGWRWCGKCMGMFYARSRGTMGICPGGGAHTDAGSGHYASLYTS